MTKTLNKIFFGSIVTLTLASGTLLYGNSTEREDVIKDATCENWDLYGIQDSSAKITFSTPNTQQKLEVNGYIKELGLKKGQRYDLTVDVPRWDFFTKRLKSASLSERSERSISNALRLRMNFY